jgi:hypothetical protein
MKWLDDSKRGMPFFSAGDKECPIELFTAGIDEITITARWVTT